METYEIDHLDIVRALAPECMVLLRSDVEGFTVESLEAEEMSGFCEAENMLVAQYQQLHGRSPVVEVVHRIEITGTTTLSDRDVTRAVVDSAFPEGTLWYGTTIAE